MSPVSDITFCTRVSRYKGLNLKEEIEDIDLLAHEGKAQQNVNINAQLHRYTWKKWQFTLVFAASVRKYP